LVDGVVDAAAGAAAAAALCELGDVEAGAEVLAAARDDDGGDAGVGMGGLELLEERAEDCLGFVGFFLGGGGRGVSGGDDG
jgi:hypothetical protein